VPAVPAVQQVLGKVIAGGGGGGPTVMLYVPLVLGVLAPNGVTCTLEVKVPCFVGVPPMMVPAAP
jgi:hypothetical protein